jgi:hypothetical protein
LSSILRRSILIRFSSLHPDLSRGPFCRGSPTGTVYIFLTSPMHATCPACLIIL